MKIRNVVITGIFVWEDISTNKDLLFTIGDFLIYQGGLYKCSKDTVKNPNDDSNSWLSIYPELPNPKALLTEGENNRNFVNTKVVRDTLFGPSGIVNFLGYNGSNTHILSWGRNLKEINMTSTYVFDIGNPNIVDSPPMLNISGNPLPCIVNTFVNGSLRYQEVLRFSEIGTLIFKAVRSYDISTLSTTNPPWSIATIPNTDEVFNSYIKINKMLRYLVKYHSESAEKYTTVFEGRTNRLDPGYDQIPNYNLQVQVEYIIRDESGDRICKKWVTIYKSDLSDSFSGKIIIDSFAKSTCELSIRNRIISVVNGAITKLIKFIGNVTEGNNGSGYYEFNFTPD